MKPPSGSFTGRLIQNPEICCDVCRIALEKQILDIGRLLIFLLTALLLKPLTVSLISYSLLKQKKAWTRFDSCH